MCNNTVVINNFVAVTILIIIICLMVIVTVTILIIICLMVIVTVIENMHYNSRLVILNNLLVMAVRRDHVITINSLLTIITVMINNSIIAILV